MEKAYKRSRILYMAEATLEYLIAILFAEGLLPELTTYLGISKGTTGKISAIISLGCAFQLISILFRRGRAKPLVLALSISNQLIFMLLYIIPMTSFGDNTKIVLFIIGIIFAYFLYYLAHPKKINWFMSLIDDKQRGKFTSKKEIISLIVGMAYSFIMSAVLSYFNDKGQIETSFIIFAITIFVLMVMHSLTMIFSCEKEQPIDDSKQGIGEIFATFKNKSVILVAIVFVLWNIASNSTKPFLGTYMDDLGLEKWFKIGFLPAISAVARIIASIILGIYADKKSFAKMVPICFAFAGGSFLMITFCSPAYGTVNGYVMFALHYILYGISMGGINSALINLCYDYAPTEKRIGILAVTQAVSGVVGYLIAYSAGEFVDNYGGTIFGAPITAEQIVSVVGVIFALLSMAYVLIFLVKRNKKGSN